MKRILTIFITILILAGALSACAKGTDNNQNDTQNPNDAKKISIVTTIFPIYDWVREILGDQADNVELTLLLDSEVDLHSYQPNVDDIVKISNCDMFIYVGGESDEWVDDILKQATNKEMVVVDLLEVLGDSVKTEEIVAGMEAENEHEDDSNHEEHEENEDHEALKEREEQEHDEHIWLSLKNAEIICQEIANQLSLIDAANQEIYSTNTAAYIKKLATLDAEYQKVVAEAPQHTLLFGDRFPFRYLVDDYSLDYFAAFAGCSAETEASFETIAFLAAKVDELGLSSILTIDGTKHTIAETIISNTTTKDQQILAMDSLQAATREDVAKGKTYLSSMTQNLEVLKEALQ